MKIEAIEIIHTFGEAIGLTAIFFTNILFIRSFMLVSSCIFLITGYFVGLKAMAIWSFVYIFTNIVQIFLLLKKQSLTHLKPAIRRLHHQCLDFKPQEIIQLYSLGKHENLSPQALNEGPENCIRFILQGEALMVKHGKIIGKVAQNHFIGQVNFFSQRKNKVDWKNDAPISYHRWSEPAINELKKLNPTLYSKFIETLSYDIFGRLGT